VREHTESPAIQISFASYIVLDSNEFFLAYVIIS
jgi:hypothetical protein